MKYVYIILYNQAIRKTKNIKKHIFTNQTWTAPPPQPNPTESPDHRPAL